MSKSNDNYKKRVSVVEAIQNGESIETVIRVFRIKRRTLFDWLSRYRAKGYDGLKDKPKSGRKRKVPGETMDWLYKAITRGNPNQYQFDTFLWTLKSIAALLWDHHKISLSKSSVGRLLKQMGLSPQMPIFKSYKQNKAARAAYLKAYPKIKALAKSLGATIFFVDESSLRSDCHRGTTWGKIGETPVINDSGDRFGLNMISAVSFRGDMKFSIIDGRMNSGKFIGFLEKLYHDTGKPVIAVVDNASYHKSKEVKEFLGNHSSISLEYLPPYSPELNPDEQVWNHAKRIIGQKFIKTKDHMKRVAMNTMLSLQKRPALISSFFQLKDTKYSCESY